MSNVEKKFLIDAQNEDPNQIDLFKNRSTGNLVYRTATGIEVVVATQVGLQDVLNRLAATEALLEIIKTIPVIDKAIKEAIKEAEKATAELEALEIKKRAEAVEAAVKATIE
jgi:flavin-binding protein dodecin